MAEEGRIGIAVRADGLQLDENREFQRGFWIAERIGWVGFALVIVLALSGLTGRGGWLAVAEYRAGPNLVEHARVARRGEATTLHVHFRQGAARHVVAVGADLLAHFNLENVSPQPVRSVAAGGGLVLHFEATGPTPRTVRLHLKPRRTGLAEARIVADGDGVTTRSLILP